MLSMIKKNKIFIFLAMTTSISLSWGQQVDKVKELLADIKKFSDVFQKHQEIFTAAEDKENDTPQETQEKYNMLSKQFFGKYYEVLAAIADHKNYLIVENIPQKHILDRLYVGLCYEDPQSHLHLRDICSMAARLGGKETYHDIIHFLDKIPVSDIEQKNSRASVSLPTAIKEEHAFKEDGAFFEQDEEEMDAIINAVTAESNAGHQFGKMEYRASTSYTTERKVLADITPTSKKITSRKIPEIKPLPSVEDLCSALSGIGKKRRRSFNQPYDNLREKVLRLSVEEAKRRKKAEDN